MKKYKFYNCKLPLHLPWLRVWFAIFFGYLTLGASIQTIAEIFVSADYMKLYKTNVSTLTVTCLIAMASFASAIIRPFAGKFADHGRSQIVMMLGCVFALLGVFLQSFLDSFLLMYAGRVFLGFGEGAIFTAGVTWLISACNKDMKGTLAGWLGLAMWLGLGIGPIYVLLLQKITVNVITIHKKFLFILPLFSLILLLSASGYDVNDCKKTRLVIKQKIWSDLWRPGFAFLLASYGYGSIQTILIQYTSLHLPPLSPFALSIFAVSFIFIRTIGSYWVSIYGGIKILVFILPIEAAGLFLIPSNHLIFTIVGIMLTAAGVALLYPSFVSVITSNLPAVKHGHAIGLLTSFWDIGILLTGPLGGAIVELYNFKTAFYLAGILCLLSLWIVFFINNMEEKYDVLRVQ